MPSSITVALWFGRFMWLVSWAAAIGCALVSVPQIVAIVRAKSARGVSATAVMLSLLSNLAAAAYHVQAKSPLAAWGEAPAQAFSACVILLLKRKFDGGNAPFSGRHTTQVVGILSFCVLYALYRATPSVVGSLLVSAPAVLGGASVTPQILELRRRGDIGTLAFAPVAFGTLGFGVRLATSWSFALDWRARASAATLFALNSALLAQMAALRRPQGRAKLRVA